MEIEYFILGVLFILVIYPVLESLGVLLLAWLEVIKGYATLKITKINAQIYEIQKNLPEDKELPQRQIGFVTEIEEEEEFDDEEE